MADELVSPSRFEGPVLGELLSQHWETMSSTRRKAEKTSEIVAGTDAFILPETFTIAGASQYIASIPQPRTVPQRVLQKTIADRPHLSIPLGPKGLGITSQRLTTKVEEPLNAICGDKRAGFKWPEACALLLYEGFCASITVVDPADWLKHPSAWDDERTRTWARRYRVDSRGRSEDHENYDGEVDPTRARRLHELDLDIHRARNVPIRHRAIGIRNCAPIFGPDLGVEGLLISQEFSTSYLKRRYRFGDTGVATPTGGSEREGGRNTSGGRTLTLIEAWLYDEDGVPYYSCCVKGGHAVATYWKSGDEYDGKPATINLQERFGIDRLPVHWEFGLGNPAETNPDKRAMGILEPFAGGWQSARAKLTANNVAIMFGSYPVLLEEPINGMALGATIEDDAPLTPDVVPMKIVQARPGTKLSQLQISPIHESSFRQIELEMGLNAEEQPGKSNKDQSGFSQSLAEAFEEQSLTTVHDALGRLYEQHGSFVLEAGKRLPELGKKGGGAGYAPIMVFASTDVPVNEDDRHNEPMMLDPDLIDETFTVVAKYDKSMSIPEKQQAMEEVARNLRTRRNYLEQTGDDAPETTELELIAEQQRNTPEFAKYLLTLVAQIQGAEEVEQIAKAQGEGLADEIGQPLGMEHGVAPAPPGMMQPLQQGAPGVPAGGSVTGMAPPSYGQAALNGVVGGGTMAGPINNAVQAGGVIPPNLPTGAA